MSKRKGRGGALVCSQFSWVLEERRWGAGGWEGGGQAGGAKLGRQSNSGKPSYFSSRSHWKSGLGSPGRGVPVRAGVPASGLAATATAPGTRGSSNADLPTPHAPPRLPPPNLATERRERPLWGLGGRTQQEKRGWGGTRRTGKNNVGARGCHRDSWK